MRLEIIGLSSWCDSQAGLRLKDKGRNKHLAIGESDRMTFKFIKPE